MDLEKLKQILIDAKIFVKDKNKNFLCICCYCGDHPDPKKRGHLSVSKDQKIPTAHCWFCGKAWSIPQLIKDITGDGNKSKEVISDEEFKQSQAQQKQYSPKKKTEEYKLPELDDNSFTGKRLYIRKRSNNLIEPEKLPGLVFNFLEFFKINNLDIVGQNKEISNQELDLLQNNFVGFLGVHNTFLYCRNIDPNSKFKFRKIALRPNDNNLLEYWSIKVDDPNRDIVVLTEGIFNSIGAYVSDTLNLRDRAKVYASGNSFSYSSLLKSVCYDNCLYKANVIILGDNDKKKYTYKKFLEENKHVIASCKIYINKMGKDFGEFPQVPVELL